MGERATKIMQEYADQIAREEEVYKKKLEELERQKEADLVDFSEPSKPKYSKYQRKIQNKSLNVETVESR